MAIFALCTFSRVRKKPYGVLVLVSAGGQLCCTVLHQSKDACRASSLLLFQCRRTSRTTPDAVKPLPVPSWGGGLRSTEYITDSTRIISTRSCTVHTTSVTTLSFGDQGETLYRMCTLETGARKKRFWRGGEACAAVRLCGFSAATGSPGGSYAGLLLPNSHLQSTPISWSRGGKKTCYYEYGVCNGPTANASATAVPAGCLVSSWLATICGHVADRRQCRRRLG